MIFDAGNMFWGSAPFASASNYASFAATASTTVSAVINMGVAQDLGVGDGAARPQLALVIGTGITNASASMTINFQFQGSTDSSNWTTYAESGAKTTASYAAGYYALPIDVPRRPSGVALPQYYRVRAEIAANGGSETISAGTIMGGIVLQRADSADTLGQYPSGFSVSA